MYAHVRETNTVINDLIPESDYTFAVKVVHGVSGHSLYSLPISVYTRDPGKLQHRFEDSQIIYGYSYQTVLSSIEQLITDKYTAWV